jgi:glycerol-3-phosphate acyltransferase PlsY
MGHNYPFYMGFKGGKGIAATSGAVIAFGDWRIIVICLAVFAVVVLTTKYMSLASLCVVTCYMINMLCWGHWSHLGLWGQYVHKDNLLECYIVAFAFTLSAFYKHRENIKRLLNGTERKLGDPKEDVDIEKISGDHQ